ncbi:MAG: PAS domain S-box protein [Hyphomicrobiales bacterium]
MVQLTNILSFKNIENGLDNLATAAWVWDGDRNRIIAANGLAVKFWHELSVLDLIDTLFGEYHPVSLQFTKAIGQLTDANIQAEMNVDFGSMDIDENISCQFSALQNDEARQIILVQITQQSSIATDAGSLAQNAEQNEVLIAKMLDNAPAALALFDKDGQFCFANKACKNIFSRKAEEFSAPEQLADWFVTDEDNSEEISNNVTGLIEKCLNYKVANISAKLATAYGARTHSIIAKSFAVKPFNDGEKYVLIYLRDVADERHYEQILVERIAKLEQLTKLGSDFYFILDDELNFVQLGGNFETLTGYPAAELLGENWHDVAERFELDPDGVATDFFVDQKSFDNVNIQWPVKDSETGLSLTWRGRSIFEQQNGENIFTGSFVTAFENILAFSDDDLSADKQSISYSEHIEILDDADDDDDFDDDDFNGISPTSELSDIELSDIELLAVLDEAGAPEDIDDLAELDDLTAKPLGSNDNQLDAASEDDAEDDEDKDQTSELQLSTLETNLTEVEAVNFANLGDALNDDISDDEDDIEIEADGEDKTEELHDAEPSELSLVDEDLNGVDAVIARSDDVIAEINDLLGESSETDNSSDAEAETHSLAANIVPAFGTTAADIEKFGRNEIDIFKTVLDQTPVMAAITSLPSEEGIYTLFANKELLSRLELINSKNNELGNEEYSKMLSVESMEHLNSLKDEFSETPIDQEISFLVEGEKYYFNAKINKIDWQDNKALQLILSPKIELFNIDDEGDAKSAVIALQNTSEDVLYSDKNPLIPAEENAPVQFSLDGQAFIDAEQNILSSNVYLNNMVGLTSDDLIGKPLGSIVTEADFNAFQDYAATALQDEEKNLSQNGVELNLINKTGEDHTIFMNIQRLDSESSENLPSSILVNMRDVSYWKKKEANLRDAKERAEQENQQKSGFLARISHELRTPLNAIIGFSEVMSDEKFGPLENSRYKGYAHDINESGEHLLSLINDLLDLSKIEAGKVELNFKAMDLEPLILQSVALMQPMADKKRIIIRTSISATLPKIIADMRSIRQIILNLLSNSIKYSNAGSQVIISALLDDDGELILRVRDTGVGMDESQLVSAMEPFKTLNMSSLVDRQGTGLGLPLTKALAEANRANFSIESAIDAGTLVQITFPTTRVLNE